VTGIGLDGSLDVLREYFGGKMYLQALMVALSAGVAMDQTTTISTKQPFTEIIASCRGQERCEGVWRGITYRLYSDRSAVFEIPDGGASWEFSCRVDAMDDSRSCTLIGHQGSYSKNAPYLMVLWGDTWFGPAVSVSHSEEAFPGTDEMLRVGKNAAFSVDEDDLFTGERAARIVSQLKRGNLVRLRYYDWPYKDSHDSSIRLEGLTSIWEAVTELRERVAE
jgi:hypothetical protein